MLETTDVEVVLEGLSQKSDRKVTTPGKLRSAQNVEFDKSGSLNKRRGYTRVDLDDTIGSVTSDAVYLNVATLADELVVYGAGRLWSVASIDSSIGAGEAMVLRGPVLKGGYSIQHVFSSSLGDET